MTNHLLDIDAHFFKTTTTTTTCSQVMGNSDESKAEANVKTFQVLAPEIKKMKDFLKQFLRMSLKIFDRPQICNALYYKVSTTYIKEGCFRLHVSQFNEK